MSDGVLLQRPPVSHRFDPIDRAEITAALEKAGLNHSSAARALKVPLRTWMAWMEKGRMPTGHMTNVALLLGLPEPEGEINSPRTPWVILRRVEDLVARLDLVEEQIRQVRDARDHPRSG